MSTAASSAIPSRRDLRAFIPIPHTVEMDQFCRVLDAKADGERPGSPAGGLAASDRAKFLSGFAQISQQESSFLSMKFGSNDAMVVYPWDTTAYVEGSGRNSIGFTTKLSSAELIHDFAQVVPGMVAVLQGKGKVHDIACTTIALNEHISSAPQWRYRPFAYHWVDADPNINEAEGAERRTLRGMAALRHVADLRDRCARHACADRGVPYPGNDPDRLRFLGARETHNSSGLYVGVRGHGLVERIASISSGSSTAKSIIEHTAFVLDRFPQMLASVAACSSQDPAPGASNRPGPSRPSILSHSVTGARSSPAAVAR